MISYRGTILVFYYRISPPLYSFNRRSALGSLSARQVAATVGRPPLSGILSKKKARLLARARPGPLASIARLALSDAFHFLEEVGQRGALDVLVARIRFQPFHEVLF